MMINGIQKKESGDKNQTAKAADQLKRVSSSIPIPSDVLFHILKRLPAKALMRFKCVSKAWQTLIYDPYFAESHHTHSQARPDAYYLLFYCTISSRISAQSVFPTNLEATFSSQLPAHAFDGISSFPCTEIVNGLICLSDHRGNQLRILNLTTGEKSSPLPKGRLKSGLVRQLFQPSYFLGFEPVNKSYKVVHFGQNLEGKKQCEILTFGDRSWRIIDNPKFEAKGRSICLNGSIYWNNESLQFGRRVGQYVQYLDLQEEKFSVLLPPKDAKTIEHLTQAGGNFALVCGRYFEPQVLWMLCSKDQVWVKVEIKLPNQMWNWDRQYLGTTKTGEMLLTARRCGMEDKYDSIFYDLESGKFRIAELRWPGKPEITHAVMAYAAYPAVSNHVENILPLRW